MENIIVTITNISRAYLYDLEVPTSITIDKLKDDIVEALNGYNPDLYLRTATTDLYCNRIARKLNADETLERAGVWNGDYITLLEV